MIRHGANAYDTHNPNPLNSIPALEILDMGGKKVLCYSETNYYGPAATPESVNRSAKGLAERSAIVLFPEGERTRVENADLEMYKRDRRQTGTNITGRGGSGPVEVYEGVFLNLSNWLNTEVFRKKLMFINTTPKRSATHRIIGEEIRPGTTHLSYGTHPL